MIERFVRLFEDNNVRLVVMFDGLRGDFKQQVSLERRATDAKTVAVAMQNISSPLKLVSGNTILPVFTLVPREEIVPSAPP